MASRAGIGTVFVWQTFIFVGKCEYVRFMHSYGSSFMYVFSGIVTPKVIYEEATDLDRFITNTGILMLYFDTMSMGIYIISHKEYVHTVSPYI